MYERNADRMCKAEAAPRIFLSLSLSLLEISRSNGRKRVDRWKRRATKKQGEVICIEAREMSQGLN